LERYNKKQYLLIYNVNNKEHPEEWLQTIEEKLDYEKWYFGHFHDDWKIYKFQMLYKSIIEFD